MVAFVIVADMGSSVEVVELHTSGAVYMTLTIQPWR